MDYRYRDYYLAKLDPFAREMRMEYFKLVAPSLKVHSPYRHIKNNHRPQDNINGRYWQMMLSCKKEDSEALEYELRKANRRDYYGSYFFKLTREICGQ